MKTAIISGIKTAISQWNIILLVYALQLLLALTVGMQAYHIFEASIGKSLEINKLIQGYDHTVITDFLKIHGASLTPLLGQLRWLAAVWLLCSIFIHAGMLGCAAHSGAARTADFWYFGARYFYSFLKIALFFSGVAIGWTALIWLPVVLYFEPSIQYFTAETYTVRIVIFLLVVYLFGLGWLFLWSLQSRLQALRMENFSLVKVISSGFQSFTKAPMTWLFLLFYFLVAQLLIIGLYWLWDHLMPARNAGSIALLFVVQQFFAFFRVALRQMMFTTAAFLG